MSKVASMDKAGPFLATLPRDLFTSRLPSGEKEFSCFVCVPTLDTDKAPDFSWKLVSNEMGNLGGQRPITTRERQQQRVSLSVLLPPEFDSGELTVSIAAHQVTWQIHSYQQPGRFRLPLAGQVLILCGHRLGEPHRSAAIVSQHFAWDLMPLDNDGLRLLKGVLPDRLKAEDFTGFGQAVLAPADGLVVQAQDGMPDLPDAGEFPTNLDFFREDLRRALGNHVILDHGNGVWSLVAHLRRGSVQVQAGLAVKTGDPLGELGNSGFSSGPHVHLQFMNGPDFLTASPLPIELELEGGTYAPQAGEITSS